MSKNITPVVPAELAPGLTDEVLEVHKRLASEGLGDFMKRTAINGVSKQAGYDDISAHTIIGKRHDTEIPIHVFALSHQQAWKPSQMIRSHVYHELNNPDGITIILPNNSISTLAYGFDDEEKTTINGGNMRPFYERQIRTAEHVARVLVLKGKVTLSGYSLGGLTAIGMASVGSDRLDIAEVHSFESPNEAQTAKALQKKFLNSGGWRDQRKAIADAHLPILSQALSVPRLAVDYARFGIASISNAANKALTQGMANPEYPKLIERSLSHYDRVKIYAGHIAGSQIFSPEMIKDINDPRFNIRFIAEGNGSHRHPTGDNPIALALMLRRP